MKCFQFDFGWKGAILFSASNYTYLCIVYWNSKFKFVYKTHIKPHKCTIWFITFHSIVFPFHLIYAWNWFRIGGAREFVRWLAVCKLMCKRLSHIQTNLIGWHVFKVLHCTLNRVLCNEIIYLIWIRLMIGKFN